MATGKHSLKHIDFSIQQPAKVEQLCTTKGRSPEFIKSRDKHLVLRYYYFNAIKKFVYDQTIELLTYELHIAPRTIARVLERESDTITRMKKERVSAKDIKKQLHFIAW